MSILSNELSSLLGGSGDSWKWSEHLHAASFRGVPFAVKAGQGEFGRRQAVHEYPYRDTAWVEDIGRSTRKLTLRGFIIQSSLLYTAADVMKQRDSLVAACEMNGPGTLVHPTLGELTVSIPEGGLRINEGMAGRVFEFSLTVIESGIKVFAITDAKKAVSTVKTSWLSVASKAAASFIAEIRGDLRTVTQAIKTIKATIKFWTGMVTGIADEATNLSNMFKSTFGSTHYGRYNTGTIGGNSSGATSTTTTQADTTGYTALAAQKVATAIENRASITAAILVLSNTTTIEEYPTNAQAVIQAMLDGIPSIYDLIKALENLSSISDTTYYAKSSDVLIQNITNVYLNVMCASAMAYAASEYSPQSYDDAIAILERVITAVDAAGVSAADIGFDDAYSEMQNLRSTILTSLMDKGADLAALTTVNFSKPLPALTLANRLYQDAGRTESLIKMGDPIHPAFMPIRFKALSS